MSEMKDILGRTANCLYRKTEQAAKITKISIEIEAQKCRLSKVYEKIGESVVSGSLASGFGKEEVFKYIDEAKTEKQKLIALIETKKKLCAKVVCQNCGKESHNGTYCNNCGEYVK